MFKRFFIGVALMAGLLFCSVPAHASPALPVQATQFAACGQGLADFLGLEPWYGCLQQKYYQQVGCAQPQGCNAAIQITALTDVWLIVLPILEDVIRIAGYLAVGFVFWGGIKYVKSQGNPSETAQARDVIRNALIGLLWVILSVTIVEFVTRGLQVGV